jgi:hypothetical protein
VPYPERKIITSRVHTPLPSPRDRPGDQPDVRESTVGDAGLQQLKALMGLELLELTATHAKKNT